MASKTALALMLMGTIPSAALAQAISTAPAATSNHAKSDTPMAEEVVVTGSHIARNAKDTPVTVIGGPQLDASGINSNALEILRKTVPAIAGRNNAGNSNANNVNQNTAGGSRVQIRNLDTLVLVDGRRLTSSGINALAGKDFVDVNRIPEAAIDRIEVLTDGASAIYGADAVGGVVNFILKSNYKGVEAGTRYGQAEGGYSERSAYITGGAGSPTAHITGTVSWSNTDPLFQNQRPFTRTYTGRLTSFPGVAGGALLNPTLSSPSQTNPTGTRATATSLAGLIANGTYIAANNPSIAPGISSQFDAAPYQTLLLRQDQLSFVTSGAAQLLGPKLEVFSDYMFSRTKSFNQTFQAKNNLSTVTVPAGAPYNPLTTAFPGVVFGDLDKPLQTYNTNFSNRIVAGLRGRFLNTWRWETAVTYDRSDLTQELRNTVYLPNLSRAIAGGYDQAGNAVAGGAYSRVVTGFNEGGSFVIQPALDPFARSGINPASVANLLGTEKITALSTLTSVDAQLSGSLFHLPAGDFGVAVGGAFRRETLEGKTDPNGANTGASARRWGGGSYFDPFSAHRTVSSGFAEARLPITSSTFNFPGAEFLELSAAGRIENYSDAGTSLVPKVGFLWRPFDRQLSFRGAYSKAFNAPTLYNVFGPDNITLSGPAVLATQLNQPKFQGLIYNQDNASNPNLKPSKAVTESLGAVLAPKVARGLTVSVDYVNITQTGFQGSPGDVLNSVDRLGPASPYVNLVAFNNFPGQPGATYVTAPGQLTSYLANGGNSRNIYTKGYFINLAGIKVQAIDFSLIYDLPYRELGAWEFSTSGTYNISYKFQDAPNHPAYEYAGYATNGGTGVQGTLPKYRLYSTLSWREGPLELNIANTIIPSVKDIGAGGTVFYSVPNPVAYPVKSYMTWDLGGAYTFKRSWGPDVKFSAGINNLFNQMPPLASHAFPDNNADTATYSPIGRLVYVGLALKF